MNYAWNSTLKRGKGFKSRQKPLRRHSKLRAKGVGEVSVVKDEIQNVVRDIVIIRDGGCIFRTEHPLDNAVFGIPNCSGFRKDGGLILQADHLITRANSATYADTRLIVCVCRGHHEWKKENKTAYELYVRKFIGRARSKLWDEAEVNSWKATRVYLYDWKVKLENLRKELEKLAK